MGSTVFWQLFNDSAVEIFKFDACSTPSNICRTLQTEVGGDGEDCKISSNSCRTPNLKSWQNRWTSVGLVSIHCIPSYTYSLFVTGHHKRVLSVQTVFQKSEVQKMKCFRNVTFNKIIKCFRNMKWFRNKTFKTWNVSDWRSKYEMFLKRDVQKMKCFRNVTFKTWNGS